jgi:hypothetical protein
MRRKVNRQKAGALTKRLDATGLKIYFREHLSTHEKFCTQALVLLAKALVLLARLREEADRWVL